MGDVDATNLRRVDAYVNGWGHKEDAPSCRSSGAGGGAGAVAVVGAARGESVVIVCEVDADPPAAVFKWKFNNSGETIDVAADRYTSNGSASSLKYTPVADLDYGTLSCAASNEVGAQLQPCVFQMVAAGKPHAPRNCSLWNQTAEAAEVSCVGGFDGGLPQTFLLEVYTPGDPVPRAFETRSVSSKLRDVPIAGAALVPKDNRLDLHLENFTHNSALLVHRNVQSTLRVNLSSDEPSWTVRGLEWGVRFRLLAVAVNGKGRSPPARLDDLLFPDPEKRTDAAGRLQPTDNPVLIKRDSDLPTRLIKILSSVRGTCRPPRPARPTPPPAPLTQITTQYPRDNGMPHELLRLPEPLLATSDLSDLSDPADRILATRAAGIFPIPTRHPADTCRNFNH
ncbi:unnamed protein product [Plutella xylostella]|uniref:(diamondback moth) hypothetical protein n=1 Tax=Plutella xylostella TaxID=51655 RepID=A0A8S4G372_PLUXY|nr:unnamed protein product [Plutella xylostella]